MLWEFTLYYSRNQAVETTFLNLRSSFSFFLFSTPAPQSNLGSNGADSTTLMQGIQAIYL